jgi:AraC-like DNA-binding protein/mannose-6-phosphate isomerase-like protein (cupin superfamily)
MNKPNSLEEDTRHGTKECPIFVMSFLTGKGTFYPEGFFIERHWHHSIEILYIKKGNYRIELNMETLLLEEGDICIVNSGVLHEIEGLQRLTQHNVIVFDPCILAFSYEDEFQKQLIKPLLLHQTALPQLLRPGESGYDKMLESYKEIVRLISEERWYLHTKLEILKMIEILEDNQKILWLSNTENAKEKEKIDIYKKIVSYMEANYMEKITLQELAEQISCNKQTLCLLFQEIAAVSPIQYLIGYRINQAKKMLTDSTRTILETSMDCGFENVSYFIRQFKRRTGMTPTEYRKKGRGSQS